MALTFSSGAAVPQLVDEEAVQLLQTFSEPLPPLPGFDPNASRDLRDITDHHSLVKRSREFHKKSVSSKRMSRVLLFWAVGTKERSMSLVSKNIDHARKFEAGQPGVTDPLQIDVYFAHYDFNRSGWQQTRGDWYEKNVQFSAEHKGVKFWLAKDLLLWQYSKHAGENLTHMDNVDTSKIPVVDLLSYEYLWFLDEDVDFKGLDLRLLVDLARRTRSNIITPSIIMANATAPWMRNLTNMTNATNQTQIEPVTYSARQSDPAIGLQEDPAFDVLTRSEGLHENEYHVADRAQEQLAEEGSAAQNMEEEGEVSSGCQFWDTTCELQRPNNACEFRYTNFVEVSFPLLKPEAFIRVLHQCKICLHYPGTIWGLDRVWCARSARTWIGRYTACAVLDSVSVHHMNYKSLPKWNENATYGERRIDWQAYWDVRGTENMSWAWNVTSLYCSANESSNSHSY